MIGREDAILGFFEGGGFFFEALLVFLVLLVFVDEVACGYNFEASQENHVDDDVMRETALLCLCDDERDG